MARRPRKKIVILGSTGSIGRNTLKVVEAFPGRFKVVGLAAGSDWRTLAEQAGRFGVGRVALADGRAAGKLRDLLAGGRVRVTQGEAGVVALAAETEADLVVSAIVGSPGLLPTFAALRAGRDVALANKEPLVMAGGLLMAEAARRGVALIPVDSEHHAISVALRGVPRDRVSAITLTASGGPFLDTPAASLSRVTVAEALRHPRWKMGSKITIDSATLLNKGLEIIEAHWLFGLAADDIRVVVHPESIVHGLVHLADGGVLAYLSRPDMRLPIAAALNHPELFDQGLVPLDLERLGRLTFRSPDHRRFPGIRLARQALREGGCAPAVLNAANEMAVQAFLREGIRFTDIFSVIAGTLEALENRPAADLGSVLEKDGEARRKATALIERVSRRVRRAPSSTRRGRA